MSIYDIDPTNINEISGESFLEDLQEDRWILDRLDGFEPSYLIDLIETHCVNGDKTVREMILWIFRNCDRV